MSKMLAGITALALSLLPLPSTASDIDYPSYFHSKSTICNISRLDGHPLHRVSTTPDIWKTDTLGDNFPAPIGFMNGLTFEFETLKDGWVTTSKIYFEKSIPLPAGQTLEDFRTKAFAAFAKRYGAPIKKDKVSKDLLLECYDRGDVIVTLVVYPVNNGNVPVAVSFIPSR